MPNPVPARYTVQLGPTVTPEVAGELAAWAELLGWSTSEVARECIGAGLLAKSGEFKREAGQYPPQEVLDRHVAAAVERGERQVRRRRSYDDRTRGAAATGDPAAIAEAPSAQRPRKARSAATG